MATAAHEYTFGDSKPAADRLQQLAQLFEPSSSVFMRQARATLARPVAVACDLGCGPGYTTRLLAQQTGAETTIGLDMSARFIDAASQAQASPSQLRFYKHDVRETPLPCPAPDLLYSRFLLTHLAEPQHRLRSWLEVLNSGGIVALEELNTMVGSVPVLERYYAIVEAMQRSLGQDMQIGQRLPEIAQAANAQVIADQVAEFTLPGDRMAQLHYLNILSWRTQAFITANYDAAEIAGIEAELERLSRTPDPQVFVRYGMRQMLLSRT